MVGTLANLAFLVEHEAASKCVDLGIESDRGVALTALYRLRARIGDPLPQNLTAIDFGLNDLFACVVVESAN